MSLPVSFIQKIGRGGLEFVPRDGWAALEGRYGSEDSLLVTPVSNVRIGATGGPEDACSDVSECAAVLRRIQKLQMKKCGLEDIAFNFMVGGDGRIYEGRGWYFKPYRSEDYCPTLLKSVIDIVYIGDFHKFARPPQIYHESAQWFIQHALEEKYITAEYTEYPDWEEMHLV